MHVYNINTVDIHDEIVPCIGSRLTLLFYYSSYQVHDDVNVKCEELSRMSYHCILSTAPSSTSSSVLF